ncbi:MAG: FtsX-like permease family protein [Thermoleophilia bacterium]|jgi:putative ABC transport system permease protein|nr:FtsX-like permease family protein [Thermoleophilia bacterium]
MLRRSWRSLLQRKLRTALTVMAILLGVAMISGTYVLTDQIQNGFDDIFTTAFKGTAVVVQPKVEFGDAETAEATLSEALLDDVRAVDGVAEAIGNAEALGSVVVDGEAVATGGAPTLILSATPSSGQHVTVTSGGLPVESGQVAIDAGFAERQGLGLGDEFEVATRDGIVPVTVAGVFTFGESASLGGTIMVAAPLADVQRWYGLEGELTSIDVLAEAGVTPEQLAGRVAAALPGDVEVKTGEQAAADATAATSEEINSFLRPALLAFGGVAVFVGAFIIFNAFSITVAQRTREFALLRALGAGRRQVLTGVIVEALLMGVAASVTGLFAGLGVASGINRLFQAVGADIPRGGLTLEPRTVIVALAVGIVSALAAALVPAWRATRVPPVAALQEGATLPPGRLARFTTPLAAVVAALAAGLVALGLVGSAATTTRLLEMGLGAMLGFIALAMVARHVVRPLARVLGWPLERLFGTSGRLARDNAARNPARTASTAAALMIGLGIVVFVAVFAQGLRTSFVDSLETANRADVVIMDTTMFTPLPAPAGERIRELDSVELAAGATTPQVQITNARGRDSLTGMAAVDPDAFVEVWGFDWVGDVDDGILARLKGDGAVVEQEFAANRGIAVGDALTVTAQNGRTAEVRVVALYRDPMLFNSFTVGLGVLRTLDLPADPQLTLVNGAEGVTPEQVRDGVADVLAAYPAHTASTQAEYVDDMNAQVNQLLILLYALLAMSVTIALFGIVNTLVLSVYERTREIGMLRAIGTTRRQVRRMVRYESVITSVIGGVLGIGVGVLFAWVVSTQFDAQGMVFAVPAGQLAVALAAAIVVGVIAAVLPARRAAQVNVLEAVRYE